MNNRSIPYRRCRYREQGPGGGGSRHRNNTAVARNEVTMINPIKSLELRTNDALSKEDRRERRLKRKSKAEEEEAEEESHATDEAGEDVSLDLVA